MDSNSELQVGFNSQQKQPSRKKCKGKEKVDEVVDKISDLPDHIIAIVLSFLQTDEAVRTSILSSRWRYLWKGISNICLHNKDPDPDKFSDLLDHVLGNCTSTEFLTFELNCPLGIDVSRLNSWMSGLHSSRIKGLTVCANGTDPYTPPASPLPQCYCTLVALKLQCCDIQIPESIDCFPHLKSLDLQVVFPHSEAVVNRLLACCPVLDKLDLFGWFNGCFLLLKIYISSTTLTTLNLQLYNIGYAFDRDLCITIVAPNLESLQINDNSCARYEVKDLSFVSNVSVNYEANSPFNLAFLKPIYKLYLFELFVGIGAADVLRLLRSTVDVLGTALRYTWPKFEHLKRLILHLDLVSGWSCMSKLLLSTPSLDVLTLNLERIPGNDSYQWTPPDVVPNCLLEHLKEIVIQQIEGNEDELKAIEYFLNNGQALQSMSIVYDPNKLNAEVMKKIRTFQRASKTCAITICDQNWVQDYSVSLYES